MHPTPYTTILLDIEGTTTPISFVYDVLFPHARAHMDAFIEASWGDDALTRDISMLRQEQLDFGSQGAPELGEDPTPALVTRALLWQMDHDKKTTSLKSIQGRLWQRAYESGDIKGVVYEDTLELLRELDRRGSRANIYSSGSIHAQKLLFGHSEHGDLRPLLRRHYDTTTGGKKEAASYERIARDLEVEPEDLLFATDSLAEARAADEAGLQVALMTRPGNPPITDEHTFKTYDTFAGWAAQLRTSS